VKKRVSKKPKKYVSDESGCSGGDKSEEEQPLKVKKTYTGLAGIVDILLRPNIFLAMNNFI